jgi:hypothetical protein
MVRTGARPVKARPRSALRLGAGNVTKGPVLGAPQSAMLIW